MPYVSSNCSLKTGCGYTTFDGSWWRRINSAIIPELATLGLNFGHPVGVVLPNKIDGTITNEELIHLIGNNKLNFKIKIKLLPTTRGTVA